MFRLAASQRNKAVSALVTDFELIEVRTGPPPPSVAGPDQGILLGVLQFPKPPFREPKEGVASAGPIVSELAALASGVAGHFRVKTAEGLALADGTAGGKEGDDMTFDNPVIVQGGTIAVASFTVEV